MNRTNNLATPDSSVCSVVPESSNNNNQPKLASSKTIINKIVLDVTKLKESGLDRRIAEVLSRQRARNTMSTMLSSSNAQDSSVLRDASTSESATPTTKSKDVKTIFDSKKEGTANVLPHQTLSRNLVMPKITITKPTDSPTNMSTHAAQLEHMDSKQRLAHAKMLLRRNLTLKRDQPKPGNQLTIPKACASAGASGISKPDRAATKSQPVILNFLNNKQREWQKSINSFPKGKNDKSSKFKRPCSTSSDGLHFPQKAATGAATTADEQCSSPIVLENKVLSADEKIDLSALRLSTYLKAEENSTKVQQHNRKTENSSTQKCADTDKAATSPDKVAPKLTKIILSAAKLKRSPEEIAALAKQIQTKIHASSKRGGSGAANENVNKSLFKWNALKTVLKPTFEQPKVAADVAKPPAKGKTIVGDTLVDNHSTEKQDIQKNSIKDETKPSDNISTEFTMTDSAEFRKLPNASKTNSLSKKVYVETESIANFESSAQSSQILGSKKEKVLNEAINCQPTPAKKETKNQTTMDIQSSIMSAVDFIAALTAEHPITESTEMEISPEELNLNATFEMNTSPLNISDIARQEKSKIYNEAFQNTNVSIVSNGDISIGKILPLNDVAILDATMDDISHNVLCIRSPNHLKQKGEETNMTASIDLIAGAVAEIDPIAGNTLKISDLPVAQIAEPKNKEPILTTSEKYKKNTDNTEVVKHIMRSKKGKINLVQRVKRHCNAKNPDSLNIDSYEDNQDEIFGTDISTENIQEKGNKQSLNMAASNIVDAEVNKETEFPKSEEMKAETEQQSLTEIVQSHMNADELESTKKSAEEETTLLIVTHNIEMPAHGPPQIQFNTEDELRKEPLVGINNLLNHNLLADTSKISESTKATKESKLEPRIVNRASRKKIVKARPLLNATRAAKKISTGREGNLALKERVAILTEAAPEDPIVKLQEIELDDAKHNEVKHDSNDQFESKTNDNYCEAMNKEETSEIVETSGNLKANKNIAENIAEDDGMEINVEPETKTDNDSIGPELMISTNKVQVSSTEENKFVKMDLKEVNKTESKSRQKDATIEVDLLIDSAINNDTSASEQKKDSPVGEYELFTADNTKNIETVDGESKKDKDSVEKRQIETMLQVSTMNDSCDNETANDESSQDESIALTERKRLRKTLTEYGKNTKSLPPSDSDDDNIVNDFFGFDEDSPTNTEIQINLSALNETTKTVRDQMSFKTSTIKNWLTTGKAIASSPQILDATATVGRGIPPKKRRELVKKPSNETDITDDTSPVDDDNNELNPLEISTVATNDQSSTTINQTSKKVLDKSDNTGVEEIMEKSQPSQQYIHIVDATADKESSLLIVKDDQMKDIAKVTDLAKKQNGDRKKKSKSKVKNEFNESCANKKHLDKPENVPSKIRKRVSSTQQLLSENILNLSFKVESPVEELPTKRIRRGRSKEEETQNDIKTEPTEKTSQALQKCKRQTVNKSKNDLKEEIVSNKSKNATAKDSSKQTTAVADTTRSYKRTRKLVNKDASTSRACDNEVQINGGHLTQTQTSKKHKDNQTSCSKYTELEVASPSETTSCPLPKRRRKTKCENELMEKEATPNTEPAESIPDPVELKNRGSKPSNATVSNFNARLLLIHQREDLNTDKVLTVADGLGSLQCGLCLSRTTKSAWLEHQATHYGVGWLVGEHPLNVSSRSIVLATMTNFFRKTNIKGLKCRLCNRIYRSSLGLLQHLEVCGEVQQRVECSFCKRSYTKFSLITHERTCASRSVERQVNDANALADENYSSSVAFSNSGRRKRVSTIKAESKLKRIGKELTVQGDAELPSFEPKEYIRHQPIPNLVTLKAEWSEKLSNSKEAACHEKLCNFRSDDLNALEQHVSECSLMPKPGYHCKACGAIFSSQKKALKHVRQRHKPKACFDVDSSDYDVKGDKESSDEYQSSGVDSNEGDLTSEHSGYEKGNTSNIRTKTSINSADNLVFPGRQKHLEKVMSKKWQNFIEKNYAKVTLFNFAMPTYQTIETSKVEKCLPKPQPSVNFCYSNKTDIPINFGTSMTQRDWTQLELYESIHEKDEHITYIGAAVRQLGWVPLPDEVKEQYLVCSYRKFEQYSRHASPKIGASVILIMQFKVENDVPNWQLVASVHYGIRIQDGPVLCFSLLPSGGYDVAGNRLGLLAVGSTGSDIKIYALPLVLINNNQRGIAILDLPPAMILTFDLKPQNLANNLFNELQCTQICWDESQNHNLIVAGFGNGCIGIWNIEDYEEENLNRFILDGGVRSFVPLHFFYFGEKNIRFLALHYGVEGARWLAVATSTRKYGIYNIRNLLSPQLLCGDVSKYVTSCLDWSPMWETLSIGCSDLLLKCGTRVFSVNPTGISFSHSLLDVSQSTPRTAHYSPELLLQAMANDNGDVIVLKVRELNLETTFHKVTSNHRAVSMLDVQTLSGAESVQQMEVDHFTENETQFREKYGILFRPLVKVPLDKKAQYQHIKRRPPSNLLSYMRVNLVRFNCNKSARNWLAVGCENGFLRIINFNRESYFGYS